MILSKINMVNFRSYDSLELLFHDKMNIFIGKNGVGKTNIIEAIYVLAITKSHRATEESQLIKTNKQVFKVKGTFKKDKGLPDNYEINYDGVNKTVYKNNQQVKKLSDYLSNITVLLFSPESIEVIKGSPSYRRKFLNIEIAQINNNYLKALNEYNYYLKTRNDLLKKKSKNLNVDDIYFNVITDKLIHRAVYIYLERFKFINDINTYLAKIYANLTTLKGLNLKYDSNVNISLDSEKVKQELTNKMNSSLNKEIILGSTIYGPHRDDFIFSLNSKNMLEFASQGQERLAILSLKLAEIKLFKSKTKQDPIILLDDVFSELDIFKKNNILSKIGKDSQIFITTTDLLNIEEKYLKDAYIFSLRKDKITRRGERRGRKTTL